MFHSYWKPEGAFTQTVLMDPWIHQAIQHSRYDAAVWSSLSTVVNICRPFQQWYQQPGLGKLLWKAPSLNVNISSLNSTQSFFRAHLLQSLSGWACLCRRKRQKRCATHRCSVCSTTDLSVSWFVFVSSLLALSLMCFAQKHPGASVASGAALIKGWRERRTPPSPSLSLTIAFHFFLLMSVHLHHPILRDTCCVSGLITLGFTFFPTFVHRPILSG